MCLHRIRVRLFLLSLCSTDADDHVRSQCQLEQLVPGAGAEDPLHGAEAGRAESLLPTNYRAAVSGPTSPQSRDQVNSTAQDVVSKRSQDTSTEEH